MEERCEPTTLISLRVSFKDQFARRQEVRVLRDRHTDGSTLSVPGSVRSDVPTAAFTRFT